MNPATGVRERGFEAAHQLGLGLRALELNHAISRRQLQEPSGLVNVNETLRTPAIGGLETSSTSTVATSGIRVGHQPFSLRSSSMLVTSSEYSIAWGS